MGFKLFELPLELRLTIYRHLFSGRNLCIKFIQYRNIGSLRCPPSPRRAVEKAEARENHEVTAIIHVCQQIRDEATPTLFANVALISGDLKGLEPMRSVFGSHNVASIQCVEVTVEQLAIRFTACFPELRVLTVHHDKTYHNGSAPADYMWREMHKLLSKYEADSLKTLQYGGRYKVYYRFIVSGAKYGTVELLAHDEFGRCFSSKEGLIWRPLRSTTKQATPRTTEGHSHNMT